MAGIEQAAAEPALPFFIQWGAETPFPGAASRAVDVRLELRGDADVSAPGSALTSPSRHARRAAIVESVTVGGRQLR